MIKRLKWNVLHGDENDASDSSSSSGDSERPSAAAFDLQALINNDPELRPPQSGVKAYHDSQQSPVPGRKNQRRARVGVNQSPSPSSADSESTSESPGDEESADDENNVKNGRSPTVNAEADAEESHDGFAEWKECLLCRGKKFFKDEDLQSHLGSKRHLKALRQFYKREEKTESEQQQHNDVKERQGVLVTKKTTSSHKEESNSNTHAANISSAHTSDSREYTNETSNSQSSEHINEAEATERRRVKRKKAAVKRKLRSLKRRKCERLEGKQFKETVAK